MPVRKIIAKEAAQTLGNGLIVIGQKRSVPRRQEAAPSGAPPKAGVSARYATREDYKKLNFYNIGPVYRAKDSSASDLADSTTNLSGDEPLRPTKGS